MQSFNKKTDRFESPKKQLTIDYEWRKCYGQVVSKSHGKLNAFLTGINKIPQARDGSDICVGTVMSEEDLSKEDGNIFLYTNRMNGGSFETVLREDGTIPLDIIETTKNDIFEFRVKIDLGTMKKNNKTVHSIIEEIREKRLDNVVAQYFNKSFDIRKEYQRKHERFKVSNMKCPLYLGRIKNPFNNKTFKFPLSEKRMLRNQFGYIQNISEGGMLVFGEKPFEADSIVIDFQPFISKFGFNNSVFIDALSVPVKPLNSFKTKNGIATSMQFLPENYQDSKEKEYFNYCIPKICSSLEKK
jgi:hypothetical protein